MCTYNGAHYVREQLESIARQTRPPDRMVIVDDCSQDETAAIVRQFSTTAPFPIHLEVNPVNLGWIKNFERVVGLCDDDLIALADQDDFWMADKLERQVAILQSNPSTGMVITNAELVDDQMNPLGGTTWSDGERANWRADNAFLTLLKYNMAQGATTVFRSRFKSLIMPTPKEWSHDAWIGLMVAALSRIELIPEPLIKYRQHANNQLGQKKTGWLELFRETSRLGRGHSARQMAKFEQVRERLTSHGAVCPQKMRQLEQKIAHMNARANLPPFRPLRMYGILAELLSGRYHQFSRGIGSAGRDFLA